MRSAEASERVQGEAFTAAVGSEHDKHGACGDLQIQATNQGAGFDADIHIAAFEKRAMAVSVHFAASVFRAPWPGLRRLDRDSMLVAIDLGPACGVPPSTQRISVEIAESARDR